MNKKLVTTGILFLTLVSCLFGWQNIKNRDPYYNCIYIDIPKGLEGHHYIWFERYSIYVGGGDWEIRDGLKEGSFKHLYTAYVTSSYIHTIYIKENSDYYIYKRLLNIAPFVIENKENFLLAKVHNISKRETLWDYFDRILEEINNDTIYFLVIDSKNTIKSTYAIPKARFRKWYKEKRKEHYYKADEVSVLCEGRRWEYKVVGYTEILYIPTFWEDIEQYKLDYPKEVLGNETG